MIIIVIVLIMIIIIVIIIIIIIKNKTAPVCLSDLIEKYKEIKLL